VKKYFLILSVLLVAAGCQKTSDNLNSQTELPALQETNLEIAQLPEVKKDLLLFSPFTRDGGKSNLFLHNGVEAKPYLPAGYYYVPQTTRSDIKPAELPGQLLVQKGTALSFYDTAAHTLTPVKNITVPSWAEVHSFYSIIYSANGWNTLLIGLVEKNQLATRPHASLLYRVNRNSGEAQQIENPLKDRPQADQDRFPIIGATYDAGNNRIINTVFAANVGYTGLESFDLNTGQKTILQFSETSQVDLNNSFLTVKPVNKNKNITKVIDLSDAGFKQYEFSLPPLDSAQVANENFWSLYTYLGKGILVRRDFGTDTGSGSLSILREEGNGIFKTIHNVRLPYAINLKMGSDGLYVFTSTSAGSQKYQVGIYDFSDNSFTGRILLPSDVSVGEVEFFQYDYPL
jgi:hypothetical protein